MSADEYHVCRNKYSYPAVGLDGSLESHVGRDFDTQLSMEKYHHELLRSADDTKVLMGYLSVLYWGHYSGQDQVHRAPRALGEVRLAIHGADRRRKNGRIERLRGINDLGVNAVSAGIRNAVSKIDAGRYGEALTELSRLPQLNFAFSSKMCAFISPEKCGVIDSVIATRYPQFGFQTDPQGFVRNNKENARRYTSYCEYLGNEAKALNAQGEGFMWKDSNGAPYSWRAVDVERAMY